MYRPKFPSSESGRRSNLALLLLLPVAILTGLLANAAGTSWGIHPSVYHGVVALAILILSPWKQAVVRRGLGEWSGSAWISILLLVFVVTTLITGIIHVLGYQGRVGPLTLMQAHIGGAVIALVLLWLHYRSHPVRINADTDLSRRSFLRSAGLVSAAGLVWVGLEGSLNAFGLEGGDRRFTGSHETGSFDPTRLPVTSWLDDRVQHVDAEAWFLDVNGRQMRQPDVQALEHDTFEAVLDCTSAWYSRQLWTGVRLDRLLDAAGHRSIAVTSLTGYGVRFPARDLTNLWLVTDVGGEPLSPGHGYPARIVAPGRRGFWWVKWVASIAPSDIPWWVQSPFPLT